MQAFFSISRFVLGLGILVAACDSDGPFEPVIALSLTPSTPTVLAGMSLKLDATAISGGVSGPVTAWSSSAPSVVEVDSNGLIVAKAIGTSTITATTGAGIGLTTVTVAEQSGTVRTEYQTSCGVAGSGDVYCWGSNTFGQAGIGTTGPPLLSPAKVAGGLSFTSVNPATLHSCGTSLTGAYCWGCNAFGEIGDGTSPQVTGTCATVKPTPTPVVGGHSFTVVDPSGSEFASSTDAICSDAFCGAQTCGLETNGQVYCWGVTPAALNTSVRFTSLSVGLNHACGVGTDRVIYCWLFQFFANVPPLTVSPVSGTDGMQLVSAGRSHTCALDKRGAAFCWGSNASGQLGGPANETCLQRIAGTYPCRSQPDSVVGGYRFESVSAGSGSALTSDVFPTSHTCGVTVNQDILCWGDNRYGQLGNGNQTNSQAPVKVASDLKFKSVTAGLVHTCAVAVSGAAYCWGYNASGQLGNGTVVNSSVPVIVSGGLTFR